MEDLLEMSQKELDRYNILTKVMEGELTQRTAAQLLTISSRQVRNLQRNSGKRETEGALYTHLSSRFVLRARERARARLIYCSSHFYQHRYDTQ